MTTDNNTAQESKNQESCFKNCQEMMKMMGQCMKGKGEKIDFEQLCGKMSDFCKGMKSRQKGE
jgi:hypothetical protein